jgi:putative membrane protein
MSQLTISPEKERNYYNLIRVLSIAIPIVVAVLLGIRQKIDLGDWTRVLPHLNAVINSFTALLLVTGFVFIKQKNVTAHRRSMQSAFVLGSLFLVSYVLYHLTNDSTSFGGVGEIRYVYFFVLISHILLSIGVVPLVLLAVYFAWSNQIARHKKMVKWTFPIWLYVSVTGVVAYLMISPYYTH